MKLFATFTLIAGLTFTGLFSQTTTENLMVSLSGGSFQQRPASITLKFLSTGTDLVDAYDTITVAQASWGMAALPYTISSNADIIDKVDSRPSIDKYMVYDMGIYSDHADTITVNASSFFDSLSAAVSSNKRITYVYLEDLTTGSFHSILNHNVLLPIPAETAMTMHYKLHVMVESFIIATPGNCIAAASATVMLSNSNHSNWNYTLTHNGHTVRTGSVFSDDTTLTNIYPTNYTMTVYSGGLLSDSISFIVYGPSPITASFTPGSSAVNVNDTVSFTNLSSGAVSFNWSFGDNTFDSQENPTHVFTAPGTYAVTLTAYNEYGCLSMVVVNITVNMAQMSSSNNSQLLMSGSSESNATVLTAAVSPAVYTVEPGIAVSQQVEGRKGTIEVRNMNGQVISSATMIDQVTVLPVNETGIYVVTIVYENGEAVTKKVMIVR